jgi:transposase
MIQFGFLGEQDRKALTALARDESSPCQVTRRANALVLLDEGWSCQQVAHALVLDDETIRGWRKLFEQREGITSFDVGGSASYLSVKQEDDLKAWVGAALRRSTRQIGAWIEKESGLVYEIRSGLIALLHRLGLEYHKPDVIPRKLDEDKQKAFIESHDKLLNTLGDNEAVLFADAVHLKPIKRLWGLMRKNVTHNKCYATCGQFADGTLDFLRGKVPKNWNRRDPVTDNFRVINPKDFRVVT